MWIPLIYTKKPPILSTIKDLYNGWITIKNILTTNSFDIIHCRGYIPALLGQRASIKFKVPFIFDMRGWWPDEKLESGSWSSLLFRPVYHYFKKKEDSFFKDSIVTVSLTDSGKKEINKLGYKNVKQIPTCTDLTLFRRNDDKTILDNKMSIGFPSDSKVLIYSGALGGNYPIEEIFLFLNAFLRKSINHYCLILSKETLPENLQLPEKTVIKSVNYTEVNKYLSIGDYGLIYYKKAFSNIGRCPTKLGEYWACGLQVLCPSKIGDLDNLFTKYPNAGFSIRNWNEAEINDVLEIAINSNKNSDELKHAAFDYFDLKKGVEFYKNLYMGISKVNKKKSQEY
ncbi:MAG: hypothetical protein H7329_00740 [Opitutaceae bacterium]|nr:hypothetical protein [Cytophagales bacterium]